MPDRGRVLGLGSVDDRHVVDEAAPGHALAQLCGAQHLWCHGDRPDGLHDVRELVDVPEVLRLPLLVAALRCLVLGEQSFDVVHATAPFRRFGANSTCRANSSASRRMY